MKLKLSEIAFLAICLICIAAGIAFSVSVRGDVSAEKIDITTPESSDTAYPVDVINNASAEDFMEVSGIGEVKAGDIIAFRDAIGGFRRVEQLKDISGISDALYARIIEHFYTDDPNGSVVTKENAEQEQPPVTTTVDVNTETTLSSTAASGEPAKTTVASAPDDNGKAMRFVDINSASAEEIADALLIDIELAESIVEFRKGILSYSSVKELYIVDGMDTSTYNRIENYIIIG